MKRKYPRPRKRLGQNFLYDPGIAARIAAAAEVSEGHTVVELGPGRGIFTEALAQTGASVIAIEVDTDLVAALRQTYRDPSRVDVIQADFTKVSLGELLAKRGLERCTLAGNIPYYLTRDVLFDFLVSEHARLDGAVIMMQREVGERIVSAPGSRVYGITSVVLQALYEIRTVMKVSPGSFHPPPKVSSVVLSFRPLPEPLLAADEIDDYRALVRNVFGQRRKTIQNTLKSAYSLDEQGLERISREAGVDLSCRPEQLDVDTFISLARAVYKPGETM